MPFNVLKSSQNPAGEPLYAAARRLRLDLEAQMVGAGQAGHNPAALHAVGLLLQIEAVDRQARATTPLRVVDQDRPLSRTDAQERA
jgi:hypothetical protein